MKKVNILYFFFFSSLLILGCGRTKKSESSNKSGFERSVGKQISINLDRNDQVSFKDIYSKIQLVPLEINKECVINKVDKTILHDNKYYLFDKHQNAVMIFNDKGKFISKIQRIGKGPGEFTSIDDIEINRFTNNIELLSPSGQIIIFDLSGNFREEITLPSEVKAVHYFKAVTADITVFYCMYEPKKLLFYSREKNQIIRSMHEVPDFIARKTWINFMRSPFFDFKDRVYYYEVFSNNVYSVNENGIDLAYAWDFGEHNFNIEMLPLNKTREYYLNFLDELNDKYAFNFAYNIENTKCIFTSLRYKGKFVSLIYNKKTTQYKIFNQFSEGVRTMSLNVFEEGNYAVIDPKNIKLVVNPKMLDADNKSYLSNIKIGDNPIVIKYYN